MSETIQHLTAPNSLSIDQPIGLFINNEFVKSTSAKKFATINPA
jgi:aldehyde dehydrogenase (NAD(P)+)